MGSTCAPSYANIYLGWWESNFVFGDELTEYTQHIQMWLCYIGNIVLIWSGTQEKFHEFVSKLNINFKVTADIDRNTGNFLDTCIFRGANNNIQTTLYMKKTATNNLLHAKSQHPQNTIKGIPTAKRLYSRFKQRGFSHNSLKKVYRKALEADRNTLLIPRKLISDKKGNEHLKTIRIIGDFSAEHEEIKQILNKHGHILEQDDNLKKGDRPTVTFRRSRNLKDRLTRSHYSSSPKSTWLSNKTKGCYKCGTCKACPWINKTIKVEGRADVKGKTKRELRRRVLEHVGDVLHKRNTSVANHINRFHNGNTSVMKFIGVEHIKSTIRIDDINRKLLQCEAQWIYWLKSKAPNGLNEGFTFTPFL
ncbi:hypothetical protein XELAEV_18009087mg [Xenopus laevis]|uniref:Reverse transcriptase domain-containing protein n=1 Tax=Xenopus laevis TaxID=8355 RepID=A0A974I0P0_XENLA|nr:hypothetical protein XELAEV_18009087mg [Xenopus laevis]